MLMPLMEYVVHDVHSRRQIVGKRIGHVQLAEPRQITPAVRVEVACRVRHDDSQDPARLERAMRCLEKPWELVAWFQMLDEMLGADAGRHPLLERKRAPA